MVRRQENGSTLIEKVEKVNLRPNIDLEKVKIQLLH
jgi:hypothetical protein